MREAHGRRCEISLQLAVVGRNDQLVEALQQWAHHTQETDARNDVCNILTVSSAMLEISSPVSTARPLVKPIRRAPKLATGVWLGWSLHRTV